MLLLQEESYRVVPQSAPAIHRCEPSWRWSPAPFGDFDLWHVIAGEGQLIVNGNKHPATPGTCFLLRPGDNIQGSHNPGKRLVVFACHFVFLALNGKPCYPTGLPGTPWKVPDQDFVRALARWIVRCGRSTGDAARKSVETGLWQMILTSQLQFSPMELFTDSRIERVLSAIEEDPGKNWDVGQLAKLAGLSRTHLSRRFPVETGFSPAQYVIMRRITRAKELLCESSLSIGEVADALGYSDVFFFSRQFKRIESKSPGAFRKSWAARPPTTTE